MAARHLQRSRDGELIDAAAIEPSVLARSDVPEIQSLLRQLLACSFTWLEMETDVAAVLNVEIYYTIALSFRVVAFASYSTTCASPDWATWMTANRQNSWPSAGGTEGVGPALVHPFPERADAVAEDAAFVEEAARGLYETTMTLARRVTPAVLHPDARANTVIQDVWRALNIALVNMTLPTYARTYLAGAM